MKKFTLSYIITTKNKLSFLKICLNQLMSSIQKNEEIIVIDAGSNDGTLKFLSELLREKKIHQFITESDSGEGHGFNKGILLAHGKLIKLITDDDYFNFPAIQDCKKIMLENENIDVMIGNVCSLEIEDFNTIYKEDEVENNYKNYLLNGEPFLFTGLSLMIRQKSISLTGLLSPNIVCVDTEFALRITEIGVKIAWSNAVISIRIGNAKSKLNNTSDEATKIEWDRFRYHYDSNYRRKKNDLLIIMFWKIKLNIHLFMNSIKKIFLLKPSASKKNKISFEDSQYHAAEINKKCDQYILNLKQETKFILPD